MVLKTDQEKIKALLKDTITLLCRNGLPYSNEFCVEALIGITLDKDDVMLVSINETVKSSAVAEVAQDNGGRDTNITKPEDESDSTYGDMLPTSTQSATDVQSTRKRSKKRKYPITGGDRRFVYSQDTLATTRDHTESDDDYDECQLVPKKGLFQAKKEMEDSKDIVIKDEPSEYHEADESSSHSSMFLRGAADNNASQSESVSDADLAPWLQRDTLVPVSVQNQESSIFGSSTVGDQTSENQQMDQCLTSADVQESSSPYAQKHGFKCVFYKCPICLKEVARKDGLRRHVERHMGRYQYYCKQCNKGFMSSTTYRGHMAKHTGIKEFQCSQCNLCFAYKRQLQTHEAKIHGQILTLSARSDDSWP